MGYVFASFRKNGEDGLHLAHSADGLDWTALKGDASFLRPEVGSGLMRDPCVIEGQDGRFHMFWTTGWHDQGIGVAHSDDLQKWSPQEFLPVMAHEPQARNCWAPEITWDPDNGQYVIYWATTIEGGNSTREGHRIHATTTRDFKEYTKAFLLYDPGFSVIDSTIVRRRGRYIMILKDERDTGKNLCLAHSDRVTGPWSPASGAFSPLGLWVEGPTAIQLDESWIVYFDEYTLGKYGAVRTADWEHWEDISNALRVPEGTRHGTVLQVSDRLVRTLCEEGGGRKK